MKGKDKCKILKEIRAKIAEENGIEFAVSECHHKGDCLGTCPKCESEVRYLEREIEKRKRLGKSALVAGIAAGITLTSVGCSHITEKIVGEELQGDMRIEETVDGLLPADDELVEEVAGELLPPRRHTYGRACRNRRRYDCLFSPRHSRGIRGLRRVFYKYEPYGRAYF